jgi:cytochrome b
MCCFLRKHPGRDNYLPETRKEMGGNIIKLAHWLTVTSWGVAWHAYLTSERTIWDKCFGLAFVFSVLGVVGFIWGARMRDQARLDMRTQKRSYVRRDCRTSRLMMDVRLSHKSKLASKIRPRR